jgi:acetylglutamate kinase
MTQIQEPEQLISSLKHAFYYVRRFKGKWFVVKLGGELASDAAALDAIANDIAILHAVGIKLVIVHGGGPQVDALSKKLGLAPQKVQGRRITDEKSLEAVVMMLAGQINTQLVAVLKKHKVPAVGLTGLDGDLGVAHLAPPEPVKDMQSGKTELVELGLVGRIARLNPQLLLKLAEQDYVPVICPLVADEKGQVLNHNADGLAAQIATALGAEKLIVLSNVPGVLEEKGKKETLIPMLSTVDAARLMQEGKADGGMVPKLEACIQAVQGGVGRTHMISGLTPHALLLETFTDSGIGTMIVRPNEKAVEDREFE